MAEIIKDNIRFSNVPNSSAKGYTGLITNADNITDKRYVYDPESDPILMALDINWGGAEVDENKIINTTGELLTWIKEGLEAASQSGGSAELSEEQLEALNTVANLLAFIKEYALRTADADARYQAKGDYVLATTYAENQAAIDEAIAALQAANEASDITSLKNQVNTLSGLILTKVDETKVNELILAKGYQTEAQVNAAIQRVVGAAPEALDTLAEIAEVLQGKEDDENPVVGLIETVGKKANSEDVYTKEQVDAKETALQAGINTNGQAINAANAAILTKANASDVYTKAQADEKFATNEDFNTFVEEVNSANETTAEALVQLQDSIENISLTPGAQGPKGDTGEAGPKGDTGAKGEDGIIGHDGKSAYELYVEANGAGYKQVRVSSNTKPDGTEAEDTSAFVGQEFLVTADAVEGDTLYPLLNGDKAEIGVSIKIVEFIDANTCRFESYNPEGTVQYGKGVAVGTGVTVDAPLSQAEWLASLKGADGAQGAQGPQGPKGDTGTFDASALEDYATKTYVSEKIAEVVGAAPETLDTLEEIATKLQEVEGITGIKGDKGDTGETGAKGDTGEAGPKGDKGDTGEQGPKGDKGDTGEQGPKGDKGDTGTFDSSVLAGYVTIEQYNALLARVVALEGGATGETGEPDNAYLAPTRTKPTAESIAEMQFPSQKPEEGLTLETSEITRPTELYLVYPSEWVTADANDNITNPVITDPNGFAQGAWVDSIVTVDGVSYTIIGTELGKDNYTITFN